MFCQAQIFHFFLFLPTLRLSQEKKWLEVLWMKMNKRLSLQSQTVSQWETAGDITSALPVSLVCAQLEAPFSSACRRAGRLLRLWEEMKLEFTWFLSAVFPGACSLTLECVQSFHPVIHLQTGRPFIHHLEKHSSWRSPLKERFIDPLSSFPDTVSKNPMFRTTWHYFCPFLKLSIQYLIGSNNTNSSSYYNNNAIFINNTVYSAHRQGTLIRSPPFLTNVFKKSEKLSS